MKFYDSIDEFPIYNWFKCIDKKEYSFVIKEGKANEDECKEVFGKLYAEYIDTFGISKNLETVLGLQNEILCLKIDKALTKDNSLQFFIDMKELELADATIVKESKVNTSKIAIEKYLGFKLNEKETTVKEYYDYLEVIKENNG